jgi:crotonobetainyl-CoA:carnitine CoA-transferase CaiB-like acyl-CoA transferase
MALNGINVLEFEALPPLQFTGQMLSDQGAGVIMVRSSKA